jgi:hypothetical protein
MSPDREISRIADRQNGNITTEQLLNLGLSRAGISRRVAAGRLFVVYRGVYAVGRPPKTAVEKATAAWLACGDGAVLADKSAAAAWGSGSWHDPPYHVYVPGDRRPRGVKTRRVKLHRKDVRRHLGMRVTSPARTALDLAARRRLTDKQLKRAIDEMRLSRTARLTLSQLSDVADRYPQHPGAKRLRWFIGQAQDEPDRSGDEAEFDEWLEQKGFPRALGNCVIHGVRVDRFFVDEGLAVELDGWTTHSDALALEDNSERDAILLDHGIETLRITRRRFKRDPDREERRLRRILERRRREKAT